MPGDEYGWSRKSTDRRRDFDCISGLWRWLESNRGSSRLGRRRQHGSLVARIAQAPGPHRSQGGRDRFARPWRIGPARNGIYAGTVYPRHFHRRLQAGAERFVIVGYSMSGRWFQWILCQFPERVLGQILITPAPAIPLQLGDELLETRMRDTREREHFDAFVRQFTSASPPHLSVTEEGARVLG